MPPLDAEYAAWPIWPSNAATEAVLTITPRPPSTGSVAAIAAAARRITLKVPIRLISITLVNCSSGIGCPLRTTRPGGPIPAQLTVTRNGPLPLATATASATASSSRTSAGAKVKPLDSACSRA